MARNLYFAVLFICCVCSLNAECPNGFYHLDESECYRVADIKATWVEAKAFCEAYGAHLVVIDTSEEQHFVEYFIRQTGAPSNTFFFAGMTDSVVEGDWHWITNTTSEYTNWYPGEPNESINHLPEDCLALITDNLHWYDANCDQRHNFVCEARNVLGKPDQSVLIG